MNFESKTLSGRVIAIPETRELDVFTGLLERRGAKVVRCPFVAIYNAPDPAPVLRWIEAAIAEEFDDVIFLTGEGLRRLLSCIELNTPHLRDRFIDALGKTRKITRGPKPARALKEIGLQSDLPAEIPTTEGIIATLAKHDLKNRRIGVQLYGADPNTRLIDWLRRAGSKVTTVAPYIYADAAEDEAVRTLGERMERKEIDAIAFTSMQQVKRMFDLLGEPSARSALAHTFVAAIGPIVADSLARYGVNVQLVPEDAFFLKPLTRALEEKLGAK